MSTPEKFLIRSAADADAVADRIRHLPIGERPWQIEIKPYRKQRTLSQNALYWKWLEIIGADLGYDRDEIHDILREKFLPVSCETILGVTRRRLTSTSHPDFTTAMMSEYMAAIERFCATDLDIYLPHPDDEYHEKMAGFGRR